MCVFILAFQWNSCGFSMYVFSSSVSSSLDFCPPGRRQPPPRQPLWPLQPPVMAEQRRQTAAASSFSSAQHTAAALSFSSASQAAAAFSLSSASQAAAASSLSSASVRKQRRRASSSQQRREAPRWGKKDTYREIDGAIHVWPPDLQSSNSPNQAAC